MRVKEKRAVTVKPRKNAINKSFGPLANLEYHVNPEWWKYIFNSLYIKTDADVIEDDAITKRETDMFLELLNVDKNASVLDLCC